MKKFNYLYLAGIACLASCSSDEFIGEQGYLEQNANGSIHFGYNVKSITRASKSGAEAAGLLGNNFWVYGIKSESTDHAGQVVTGNTVFQNYLVNYKPNTANTTESNAHDWEYVGVDNSSYANGVLAHLSGNQTIKYWDYSAPDYTFYAVSAKAEDLQSTTPKVIFTKVQNETSSVYKNGYTIATTAGADLEKIYVADRVNIEKSSNEDKSKVNTYGGYVNLTFRNVFTKIRAGIYETVPGYSVTIDKMYGNSTDVSTTNFMASAPNTKVSAGQTFGIEYYDNSTDLENQPKLTVTSGGTVANTLELGTGVFGSALEVTSAAPTWDNTGNYTMVMPQADNTTNLKLKIDYTLTSTDGSNEKIKVTGATAEVPAQYIAWKPNHAYTYLFKISNNTNGTTGTPGTDPSGLFPITFDAVVVTTEDGNYEYITTVSEPSITTYAKNSNVTTDNEYAVGAKVYTVVEDNSGLATLSASNTKLYTVLTTDNANYPITEASVANAIEKFSSMNDAQKANAKILTSVVTLTDANFGKQVVDADGNMITMHETNNVVMNFTTEANNIYAIEYTSATQRWNTTGNTYADEAAFNTAATSAPGGHLYKDEDGTEEATWGGSSTTYYTRVTKKNSVPVYKIVKVKDAVAQSSLSPATATIAKDGNVVLTYKEDGSVKENVTPTVNTGTSGTDWTITNTNASGETTFTGKVAGTYVVTVGTRTAVITVTE